MKITPATLTLTQLFSGANEQFVIPPYQRRYSWRERQIYDLLDDIKLIEGSDTHLLGTIVCLTVPHIAGINALELVDGQQRLTMILIIMECIRRRLEESKELLQTSEISRLLTARPLGGRTVRKIALESRDDTEFERLIGAGSSDDQPPVREQDLETAFNVISASFASSTTEELLTFLYKLQNSTFIIRLDVSDARDAFKLFETINNRGLRLSPTDIIKNSVLGNAARFGSAHLKNARESWANLITYLDGTETDAFFRDFLTARVKRRVTRSKVVAEFKAMFMGEVKEAANLPDRHLYLYEDEQDEDNDDIDTNTDSPGILVAVKRAPQTPFRQFLSTIVVNARIFGELVRTNTDNVGINRHLRNLRMIRSTQAYGFLMYLRSHKIDEKHFLTILKLTEDFILRRHICKERTNETDALFARLCAIDPINALTATRRAYREECPDDDKFKEEFVRTDFSNNMQRARYCLEQLEISKHGKHTELKVLESDAVHIEHIIPQKISTKKSKKYGDWAEYLGDNADGQHKKVLFKIGNLTLFSGELNVVASNNPFSGKKAEYRKSAVLMTQELCKLPGFKFKQVDQRGKELAELALTVWPIP